MLKIYLSHHTFTFIYKYLYTDIFIFLQQTVSLRLLTPVVHSTYIIITCLSIFCNISLSLIVATLLGETKRTFHGLEQRSPLSKMSKMSKNKLNLTLPPGSIDTAPAVTPSNMTPQLKSATATE